MSRVFSIPTVLRMVPNHLLRQFFEQLGHAGLDIPWDDLGERDIAPIVSALSTLTSTQFDTVEGALRTIYDLACDTGIAAIFEAGELAGDPDLRAAMPEEAGLYERAMWAWLNRGEIVDRAALIHRVENMTWWRRRDDLPAVPPDQSPEARDRLARGLSDLLVREQGRGRICTVDVFTRRGTVYFFAYPDDFVQNVTAHDDDRQLAPRTFRSTFSVVFAFCPADGSLELFARLPPRIKVLTEGVFAQSVLDYNLGEWRPDPSYELNGLKGSGFSPATDPEDGVTVHVRQMRLSLKNSHRTITLKADPDRPGDIFRMLDEVLDKEQVPLSSVNVTLVTFCFEFDGRDGRRAGSVTFDVAFPSSCSLRNQPADRIEIVMKCLRRWGIYAARPTGPTVAAAG
jgi:hypothetical protein